MQLLSQRKSQIASQKGCTSLQLLLAFYKDDCFTMVSSIVVITPDSVLQDDLVYKSFVSADWRHLEQITVNPYPSLSLGRGLEKHLRVFYCIPDRLDQENRNMPFTITKSEPRTIFILSSLKDHWQPRFPLSVKWGRLLLALGGILSRT